MSVNRLGLPENAWLEPIFDKYFSNLELSSSKTEFLGLRIQRIMSRPFQAIYMAPLEKLFISDEKIGIWSRSWSKIQKAYFDFLKNGPIVADHTNKWGRPLPLFLAAKRLLAKLGVQLRDGYKTYPDNFCQDSLSQNVFHKRDHVPWQFLNPPFNATGENSLEEHIHFWMKHAEPHGLVMF